MKILKNFIVFEGLDGAGTSTQSKLLNSNIENSILTCEPTGGETGMFIRRILRKEFRVTPKTFAYLFAADRNEHIYSENGIFESCNKGKIVICDRYLFSSLAYQGLDLPISEVFEINKEFVLPEIVFFLNTEPEICEKRIDKRGQEKEIFEEKSLQERILSNYKAAFKLFENSGTRIIELDGGLPVETLLEKETAFLSRFCIG